MAIDHRNSSIMIIASISWIFTLVAAIMASCALNCDNC